MSERLNELVKLESELYFPGVRRWPLALVRGAGSTVWDSEGKTYIDLTAGWGVTSIGHSHPKLVAAISDQAQTLMQTTNTVYSEPQLELAQRLGRFTPPGLKRCFFVSSGAEANEGALKLAHKSTGRSRYVATLNSFHGRTLGVMGCLGQDKYRARWKGIVREATFVPYGDLDAAKAALSNDVAGMIVEPVQGEGGVVVPPPGYIKGLSAACREVGARLILDEIQTGIGRTGRWFAFEHSGVTPDILTLAKGLGGGVPIGAFMATDEVLASLEPGDHGGTYAGNLLTCRAAATVLEVIEDEELVARSARLGDDVLTRLADLANRSPERIESVRGRGLLIGLVLRNAAHAAAAHTRMREHGVLVNLTADRVLRLFPALNIPEDELDQALDVLEKQVLA